VEIRSRRLSDIPGAAKALVEVYSTDGYPVEGVADPEEWLRSDDLIEAWVAERDSKIVGHVAIFRPSGEDAVDLYRRRFNGSAEDVAVLARLFVIREARRHAVGERLMMAATQHAAESGKRLVLDVMTKDQAAIRLYERLGWQPLGSADHEYGDGQQTSALCFVSPAVDVPPQSGSA
jgi:ribosomal protein S18 acetylase RimI-like enzyme